MSKATVVAQIESIQRRLLDALPRNTEATVMLAVLSGFARSVLHAVSVASGMPYPKVARAFADRILKTNAAGDELE